MRSVMNRDLPRAARSRWLALLAALVLITGVAVLAQPDRPASAGTSTGTTLAASVDGAGHPAGATDDQPAVSGDGRYVAFATYSVLDPLDGQNDRTDGRPTPEFDIYVRDTRTNTTTYLSRGYRVPPATPSLAGDATALTPVQVPSDGSSRYPTMSADGRLVAFVTLAGNISGWWNSQVLVVCDRGQPDATGAFAPGCTYTTILPEVEGYVVRPRLSADGTRLAFIQDGDVRVVEMARGSDGRLTYTEQPVPVPPSLVIGGGELTATIPRLYDTDVALSADGRHLIRMSYYYSSDYRFASSAAWVNDLVGSGGTSTWSAATRVDLGEDGRPLGAVTYSGQSVAISGDGRRIAFASDRSVDSSHPYDPVRVLYQVNRDPDGNGVLGPARNEQVVSTIVSRAFGGTPPSGAVADGDMPSFSADGRYLAFVTDSLNVHNGVDTAKDQSSPYSCIRPEIVINSMVTGPGRPPAVAVPATVPVSNCDVVVRDVAADEQLAAQGRPLPPAELASAGQVVNCGPAGDSPCEGNADSIAPSIDADGSAVAFNSAAGNLVNGDTDASGDAFLRRFQPTMSVEPKDFGVVPLYGQAIAAVSVRHHGFGPLRLSGLAISITGPQSADYRVFPGQTCEGVVLYENGSCLVSVRFRPASAGSRAAQLAVALPAGTTAAAATGALTGIGSDAVVLPPRFDAQPNPLAFGSRQTYLDSTPQDITVTNLGSGFLVIRDVSLVGAAPASFPGDYRITANTCLFTELAPKDSCTVTVVFTPHALGDRPAMLQFTDNAQPGPQLVGLTGTGAPPVVTVSPALGRSGTASQVTGTNFPPGMPVLVTLDGMAGSVAATADASGAFSAPLVIFPHTEPGPRKLHVAVQGLPVPITVDVDFLVVPGSLQPPDFVVRG